MILEQSSKLPQNLIIKLLKLVLKYVYSFEFKFLGLYAVSIDVKEPISVEFAHQLYLITKKYKNINVEIGNTSVYINMYDEKDDTEETANK